EQPGWLRRAAVTVARHGRRTRDLEERAEQRPPARGRSAVELGVLTGRLPERRDDPSLELVVRQAADAGPQQSRGAQRELSVTVALERDLVVTTGREDHLSHGGLGARGRAPARGAQPLTESAVRRLHLGGGGQEARAHVAAAVGGRRPHHEPG